jgi:hypothetical protein
VISLSTATVRAGLMPKQKIVCCRNSWSIIRVDELAPAIIDIALNGDRTETIGNVAVRTKGKDLPQTWTESILPMVTQKMLQAAHNSTQGEVDPYK